MKRSIVLASTLALGVLLSGCLTAEEEFIDDHLLDQCNDSYPSCNQPTGCILDKDHYVEGVFPGVRRVVVVSEEINTEFSVRIFLRTEKASGTELLVNLYETDCSINPDDGRVNLLDVDIFDEAGDDRMLVFDLNVFQKGEHLLEIYSDASAEYLLIAEPK